MHKALIGQVPDYITNLLTPVTNIPSRSSLRASSNSESATSSNQEPSGELVTMHSLSPHLVHGITYRQN